MRTSDFGLVIVQRSVGKSALKCRRTADVFVRLRMYLQRQWRLLALNGR